MPANGTNCSDHTSCAKCPLAARPVFRPFEPDELSFVSGFKAGELSLEPGATILLEGTHNAHLFTVLSGWGFRYKFLSDGRRQILNYILPGDMVGLQGSLMGETQHSVEALTGMRLCVFEKERLTDLYRRHPSLAYDITWIAAQEERFLDEHLLSIGQRSALERAAYLLAFLYKRIKAVGASERSDPPIPISQNHVADTLGLSIVHTNKTLRKLVHRGLIAWQDRTCRILDVDALCELAGWSYREERKRPFL